MKKRLSIGTVLLAMNLAALILPLSGFWMLRLYESALIRQTESELIAQAGVIAALYRHAWRTAGGDLASLDSPIDPKWTANPGREEPWLHRFASLDLAEDSILPPPPDPAIAIAPPNAAFVEAGWSLEPVLRDAQHMTLAGMRILDNRGVVISSTGEDWGLSLTGQEEVRRALMGEAVSVLRQRTRPAGEPGFFDFLDRSRSLRVFVARPVLEEGRVAGVILLSRTPRAIVDTLYGKRWHLAALLFTLGLAIIVLVRVGIVVIARPIRAVTDQAKRVADGERGALIPLRYPQIREVAELSQALARMASTLEQRADYIRDFAAHVSHEFKTPLTTIQGAVELLRDHLDDMSIEERNRFLSNMDAETKRLSQLVRRLLDLARADVMIAPPAPFFDAAPLLSQLANHCGAAFDCPDRLIVAIDAESLRSMIGNLLDNSRQHAGLAANIRLYACKDNADVIFRISDDGPGVSPANQERIFAPFFTTARKKGGTGLGLAIVRSLVSAYGGVLTLLPSAKGAVFEIRFKNASDPPL